VHSVEERSRDFIKMGSKCRCNEKQRHCDGSRGRGGEGKGNSKGWPLALGTLSELGSSRSINKLSNSKGGEKKLSRKGEPNLETPDLATPGARKPVSDEHRYLP